MKKGLENLEDNGWDTFGVEKKVKISEVCSSEYLLKGNSEHLELKSENRGRRTMFRITVKNSQKLVVVFEIRSFNETDDMTEDQATFLSQLVTNGIETAKKTNKVQNLGTINYESKTQSIWEDL